MKYRGRIVVLALWLLAGCGQDPVPDSLSLLKNGDVKGRRQAARALGEMGHAAGSAVPLLIEATMDSDAEVRRLAGHSLGEIGFNSDPAKSALVPLLKDPKLSVRLAAALALQKLSPDDDVSVPVLVSAMRMGEGGVIVKVGEMGEQAHWAMPVLTELLRDRRPGTRRLAVEALGKIGPDMAALAMLRQALRDPDDRVRYAAQQSLDASESTTPTEN